jgi:murein DD-endopeptidase MepM/ murein hydrolase activator NlpD
VIVYAGWNDWGYGNVIVIDHGNGWQTLYAHLSQIRVGCGQSVNKGDLIGNVGSTGNSSGPHLHFEMMLSGTHQNPHLYLP